MDKHITAPITKKVSRTLRAGDYVYITGTIYTAREGRSIGSAGSTTASCRDRYALKLLDLGLTAMIGKGKRSPEVLEAVKRNGSVYLAAVGGAGALLSKCIKESEVVAYNDLGAEAIRKLKVEDFPAIVVAGCILGCSVQRGNNGGNYEESLPDTESG